MSEGKTELKFMDKQGQTHSFSDRFALMNYLGNVGFTGLYSVFDRNIADEMIMQIGEN